MLRLTPCTCAALLVLAVLPVGRACGDGCGHPGPQGGDRLFDKHGPAATDFPVRCAVGVDPVPVEPPPPLYDLRGTVVDATPDISEEHFAKLVAAESEEEFGQALGKILRDRPAPDVVVTLRGESIARTTVTDPQGRFEFTGLPRGAYEVSAEMPSLFAGAGEARMATARKEVTLDTHRQVALALRADLVTVSGRIIDDRGRPVAGAAVIGEPYPMPEVAEVTPASVFAVSLADGSYELEGLIPYSLYRIAGYLNGGDPTESGQYPFYVEIRVRAEGWVQDRAGVPRLPIVTEELLDPARRLLQALSALEKAHRQDGRYDILGEKAGLPLPASHGNTITGIDIVLQPAGDRAP
jgi:hypothetical protein